MPEPSLSGPAKFVYLCLLVFTFSMIQIQTNMWWLKTTITVLQNDLIIFFMDKLFNWCKYWIIKDHYYVNIRIPCMWMYSEDFFQKNIILLGWKNLSKFICGSCAEKSFLWRANKIHFCSELTNRHLCWIFWPIGASCWARLHWFCINWRHKDQYFRHSNAVSAADFPKLNSKNHKPEETF